MSTHYHGQILNSSEIGRSLGFSDTTIRSYFDVLSGTFMLRILKPWIENISKRQIKSPKIYFRDSGILHSLMGLQQKQDLLSHPKLGASWEGFALEQVIKLSGCGEEEVYFWATQNQAELDLLILKNGKKIGFEFKYSSNPQKTPSMKAAINDLQLQHLYVVTPLKQEYKIDKKITVTSLDLFKF
jgi:predicted AAA+ superfamily ATPase